MKPLTRQKAIAGWRESADPFAKPRADSSGALKTGADDSTTIT